MAGIARRLAARQRMIRRLSPLRTRKLSPNRQVVFPVLEHAASGGDRLGITSRM
jgi:hypothetical protein